MARTHFNAEGEVSFKAILFVPNAAERDMFNDYGQKRTDNIKMYVRRVFITDDFTDMMPKYLQFIRGVVDSDDLPLNVSRETLQQHKLLKVIKKKLVRKALDMIKKIDAVDYLKKFWKEYSTNVKLGVIEDHSNRTRLAKLLRFLSSHDEEEPTSLEDYIERMKDGQEKIYFCGGNGLDDVKNSPFTERLLKKGYEVLYLTEPVDEYAIQALPEFDGKRFQNVAKEGVETPDDNKNFQEKMEAKFEPLLEWIKSNPLREKIDKAIISQQLESTPAALQASQYGWDANMERIMKAQAYNTGNDASSAYYAKQKKTLLLNPRHPLVKTLLEKVEADESDEAAIEITKLLFDTAALRSGYTLREPVDFADRILNIMYANLEIDPETPIDDEPTAADFEDEDDELVDEEEVDADAEEEVFDEETDDVKDEL
jgi:heat shock protein beta